MFFSIRVRVCLLIGLMSVCSLLAPAARGVGIGDVAVISFAADDPDAVAFVALREIPAGTVIRFTDSGWQAGGGFRANEGGIQYTAAGALSPGTVVSRTNPFSGGGWSVNSAGLGEGGFALSTSGDQILTFIGDASSPSFLHAIDFDSTTYSDATNSNTTALPPGLAAGASAVDLGEFDNGYYSGPTIGTASALLAAIGNASNWTASESPLSPPGWSFDVQAEGPQVQSVTLPDSSFPLGTAVQVTVQLSMAPDIGSPVTVELTSGALASAESLIINHPDTNGVAQVNLDNEGIRTLTATAVSGGVGSVVSASFTVGNPQIPPTAIAGADRSVQLGGATVTVALDDAAGDDADGLAGADYAWTPVSTTGLSGWQNRSGPLTTPVDPAAAIVTFDAVGVYTLTLTITDADDLVASDTMTITVSPALPVDEYDPPDGYYDTATGQGGALKTQLAQIMTAGHVQQQYGDLKTNAARYDADPALPGNILLVYNRASVPGGWDGGSTWNREHIWPQSLQPGEASDGSTGNLGDPYALRPINPSINSSRGNKPFGTFSATGSFGATGGIYYFPGDQDKGDIARSLFYSATRYLSTLSLVNGDPAGNQMGDLAALLRWHYTDVPDVFERRRGQLIYDDQHNRNAFIDRPEFVWSIFGDGANDSTLYVSATEPADGASVATIGFPPVIIGGPLPASAPVVLQKAGDDPTYYFVSAVGTATSSVTGRFNAFDFGVQQRTIFAGVAGTTNTAGALSGTVLVDNLDVSSEGAGQGVSDGDDVIHVSLTVYDHAEASFAAGPDVNALTIGFGAVASTSAIQTIAFNIHNLVSTSGFTASLDLSAINSHGDTAVLTSDAAPFSDLPAGQSEAFAAAFDPSAAAPGAYTATYTFAVADESLPGGAAGAPLTLTLTGTITSSLFPFDDDGDGDVDDLDAASFMNCLAGPNAGLAQNACSNHDWDEDGDVDLFDAMVLQTAFTGQLP